MIRPLRALTGNEARTDPASDDPALVGRTYAIPFDRVWTAALELASEVLRGWTVVASDDEEGVIRAEARTVVFCFVDDVLIEIGLDRNAQTRVDMESKSRVGRADLGTNRRRVRRFFRKLDRGLEVRSGEILDGRASVEERPEVGAG